jgi:transcriptional regulator GlxA family with amidase domain
MEQAAMDYRIQTVLGLIRRDIRCAPGPREIASEVGLSVSRFYDLFRQETGTVPATYIRKLRYEKAQELLTKSTLSIKEITALVGIRDVSHFVRDFQRVYGLSPRGFRQASRSALDPSYSNQNTISSYSAGRIANKP